VSGSQGIQRTHAREFSSFRSGHLSTHLAGGQQCTIDKRQLSGCKE
jgi:hypothetical protein